jgi:hypothetical protein
MLQKTEIKYGWKELEMRNNFAPKIRNKMWLERA